MIMRTAFTLLLVPFVTAFVQRGPAYYTPTHSVTHLQVNNNGIVDQ